MSTVDAPTAQQPAVAALAPVEGPAPAADTTSGYIGRHRAGRREQRGTRHQIADLVTADYNPLHPADRLRLNPSRWQAPGWFLHAGVDEHTGVMPAVTGDDTAVIPAVPAPADRGEVLAELQAAVTTPANVLASLDAWVADGCPIDDQTATATDTTKDPA